MSDSTSSTANDSTPKVGCDCIMLTNEALKEHNCALDLAFEIDRETGAIQATVACHTVLLEKKRGAKALNILASYCPFCGAKYGTAAQAPESAS